jgi:hypothetical protein
VEVPDGGQVEVPVPRWPCRSEGVAPGGDCGWCRVRHCTALRASIEVCEGTDGHHFGLPRGRHLPRAAAISGTTHKTVRRVIARHEAGGGAPARLPRPRNHDAVAGLVAEKVKKTSGRISAKRLLLAARAAGYAGSDRNLRRLVAEQKQAWRAEPRRGRPPAVWSPGEYLVIDWGAEAGLHVFRAVLAWSRVRFVRFAGDEQAETADLQVRARPAPADPEVPGHQVRQTGSLGQGHHRDQARPRHEIPVIERGMDLLRVV